MRNPNLSIEYFLSLLRGSRDLEKDKLDPENTSNAVLERYSSKPSPYRSPARRSDPDQCAISTGKTSSWISRTKPEVEMPSDGANEIYPTREPRKSGPERGSRKVLERMPLWLVDRVLFL